MADNRIYLKCRNCGDTLFLGKRIGFGYYWRRYNDDRPLEVRLNEFYEAHEYCGKPDCFEIEYEVDDDGSNVTE